MVPASLQTNLSAVARVVELADVPPSIKFSSVVVAVIPSRTFISVAVDVTPSKIFSSAAVLVTPSRIFNSAAVEVTLVNLLTGRVPVIELAAKSRANSVDSMTSPPFDFKSTEKTFPVLSRPSPAVVTPAEEN